MLTEICKGLAKREICLTFFFFLFFSEFYSPTQVLPAIYAAWKIDSGKNKCRIGHELWDIVFYIYKPVC